MKLTFIALLLLITPSLMAMNVGDTAKDFSWLDGWNLPAGKSHLSDFTGQWVLVEVWSST